VRPGPGAEMCWAAAGAHRPTHAVSMRVSTGFSTKMPRAGAANLATDLKSVSSLAAAGTGSGGERESADEAPARLLQRRRVQLSSRRLDPAGPTVAERRTELAPACAGGEGEHRAGLVLARWQRAATPGGPWPSNNAGGMTMEERAGHTGT
jgi:hypothetical protein